jgi:hypothetical protein
MPNLSVRGLDRATLARIRSVARLRRVSVNRVIIETLREQYASSEPKVGDLDRLAGTWSKAEADEFDAAIAPFGEVDRHLWATGPKARSRAKRKLKPRTRR